MAAGRSIYEPWRGEVTDWDNLEGDALDLALVQFAPEEVRERARQMSMAPPYHRSVDASIRDLVPRLGDDFYWLMLFPGEAAMGWRPHPHDETKPWETETIGGKDTVLATAVARVMGKALEGRSD